MSVNKAEKAALIAENARQSGDTGSVEVQVAVLTARISNLTTHLKQHRKDKSTTRGLVAMGTSGQDLRLAAKPTPQEFLQRYSQEPILVPLSELGVSDHNRKLNGQQVEDLRVRFWKGSKNGGKCLLSHQKG